MSSALSIPPAGDSPESRNRIAWLQAIPDFGLSLAFLVAWIAPGSTQPGFVRYLLGVLLLEFIIIHSSAFMGNVWLADTTRAQKTRAMLGLGAFYSLFALGFAFALQSWWPLLTFWGLMMNRMFGVLFGQAPKGEERLFLQCSWAAHAMFYLLAVFLTTPFPVPQFGLTASVVSSLNLPGSGLWVDEPQHAVAAGFLYFLFVALSGVNHHRWARSGAAGAMRENARVAAREAARAAAREAARADRKAA